MQPHDSNMNRRTFLLRALGGSAALFVSAWGGGALISAAQQRTSTPTPAPSVTETLLAPTPACGDDDDEPTIQQTEGPFYTPDSPERASFIEDDTTGTPLTVTGFVVTTACAPVAGALLDFWHADDDGEYDNVGYRYRGHFFADDEGRWTLETILPGLYPGRTRHFHVKVQAPNGPILTTQLYFPDEPMNARDGIFDEALLMQVEDAPEGEGKLGYFTFVLAD